jgi:hypothetical protein
VKWPPALELVDALSEFYIGGGEEKEQCGRDLEESRHSERT